jgi:tetraacyldisaccharide 4'-kinase
MTETARDVIHISFPDHHMFNSSDIVKVVKAYHGITNPNKIIVTTEKDAMRLLVGTLVKDFGDIPVFYLPIRVQVNEENVFEDTIIEHLNPLVPAKPIRKLEK